jgi:tetratricopeptide (TPR) repeat protein
MKTIVVGLITLTVCGSALVADYGYFSSAQSQTKRRLPDDAPGNVLIRRVALLDREGNDAWSRDHDFLAAQAKYREALALHPGDGVVLYDYAHCCDHFGKSREAFDAYAALLHPPSTQSSSAESDPFVLARYAELAESLGEPEEATWGYSQASKYGSRAGLEPLPPPNPSNAVAIKTRALLIASEAARQLEQDEKAAALLQRAFALSPNSAEVNYYLGQSSLRQGRELQAADRFKRCRELAPDGPLAIKAAKLESRHRPVRKVFGHDSHGNLVDITGEH